MGTTFTINLAVEIGSAKFNKDVEEVKDIAIYEFWRGHHLCRKLFLQSRVTKTCFQRRVCSK